MNETFVPMGVADRNALLAALMLNSYDGGNVAILTSERDTSFVGIVNLDEREIESRLINAIKATPTHY